MRSAAGTIPLVSSGYSFITDKNLNTKNPKEYADTNEELFKYNINREIPPCYATIPLVSSGYSVITDKNLNTLNPPEFVINEQIFPEMTYTKLTYSQNPNAFRNEHSFMAPLIPKAEDRTYAETTNETDEARKINIIKDVRNLNNYMSFSVMPEKFVKFRTSNGAAIN